MHNTKLVNIGSRFGRLQVIARAGSNNENRALWECLCDCGKRSVVIGRQLFKGRTKSCGCLRYERLLQSVITHGQTAGDHRNKRGSPEYRSWISAKCRVFNPKSKSYPLYGERGITMCPQWANDFSRFYADMGPMPSQGLTLERIDNDKNYEPGNCRWATKQEQSRNRRPWKVRRKASGNFQFK